MRLLCFTIGEKLSNSECEFDVFPFAVNVLSKDLSFAASPKHVTLAAQLAVVQAFPLASHKGEAFFAGGGGDGRSCHGRGGRLYKSVSREITLVWHSLRFQTH